jgi:hypothetical protein
MDDARLEDYTGDAPELADSIPVSPSLTAEAPDMGMDLDLEMADLDFVESPAKSASTPMVATAGTHEDFGDLDFDESISFSSFSPQDTHDGDLDADVAELAAQLDAFDQADTRFSSAESIESVAVAEREIDGPAVVAPAPTAKTFDFSDLSLLPMGDAAAPVPVVEQQPAYTPGSGAMDLQLAAIVEHAPTTAGRVGAGAVLVLAGLGGPDAVRQLLSSLPERLQVPILLYQHLEVGKHERLVDQLAKISRLPVVLARNGSSPESGKVTLLPAGMTAVADGGLLTFTAGSLTQLIAALPARDSVIVVLSGADAELVPMIMWVAEAGGLVLAQDPEVCFDASAAEAMQRQGAAVYPALGLARQVAARWSL